MCVCVCVCVWCGVVWCGVVWCGVVCVCVRGRSIYCIFSNKPHAQIVAQAQIVAYGDPTLNIVNPCSKVPTQLVPNRVIF